VGVVAIYQLPVPIWISAEVLGERISSGFGSVTFDVLMPTDHGPVGTAPEIEGVEIPTREADSDELLIWAQRFAAFTPGADAESTALCRVVVQTQDLSRSSNEPYDLARGVAPWFDALRTWVEAMTGQDLDPYHRVYDAVALDANLTVLEPAPSSEGPIAFTLTTPRITPVPAGAWRRILARVAAGEEPPLEEQLSRDSRAAFVRGQLRRSVSDAASAAEIVLHRLIEAQARPEDMRNRELRRKLEALDKQPLGGLVTLAREAGLDLGVDPDDLDDLSVVRNNAIHRAETPEYQRAYKVVQAAIDLLGGHGPWKRTGVLPNDGSEWVEVEAELEHTED
jgi:hypothetical protein